LLSKKAILLCACLLAFGQAFSQGLDAFGTAVIAFFSIALVFGILDLVIFIDFLRSRSSVRFFFSLTMGILFLLFCSIITYFIFGNGMARLWVPEHKLLWAPIVGIFFSTLQIGITLYIHFKKSFDQSPDQKN
jgi:hypothetical protein